MRGRDCKGRKSGYSVKPPAFPGIKEGLWVETPLYPPEINSESSGFSLSKQAVRDRVVRSYPHCVKVREDGCTCLLAVTWCRKETSLYCCMLG